MSTESASKNATWNILIVDDEPDVHQITSLALKHQQWRKRRFTLKSAHSGEEARKILAEFPQDHFQVAIVDVVMESDQAGLELCRYLRETFPSSLRIILRTGQPGTAPEEMVLNEYDIDYYVSKTEATREKLYSVIRACLRSSQDISTLMAFGKQLQSFTRALQSVSSLEDLLVFMREGLGFLELKHSSATAFFYDIDNPDEQVLLGESGVRLDANQPLEVLQKIGTKHPDKQIILGAEHGLGDTSLLLPFEVTMENPDGGELLTVGRGGLFAVMNAEWYSPKSAADFRSDASLFIENWRIAYATLKLQERLARERMLREQMYYERIQSIATMVTGVAHEMNTPLGVANTAANMIVSLADDLANPKTPEDIRGEIVDDFRNSCDLITRNLQRAHRLIGSFKQLSGSQLSDQRTEVDLHAVLSDCLETMSPELRKRKIEMTLDPDRPSGLIWDGFPGHLTQVVVNLIQNSLRYAYDAGTPGKIGVKMEEETRAGREGYHIVFQDWGKGVPADIKPTMFEPFVTSGRGKGGTGLGLAITHNIITNLLSGEIRCDSEEGKGAVFDIWLPLRSEELHSGGNESE